MVNMVYIRKIFSSRTTDVLKKTYNFLADISVVIHVYDLKFKVTAASMVCGSSPAFTSKIRKFTSPMNANAV